MPSARERYSRLMGVTTAGRWRSVQVAEGSVGAKQFSRGPDLPALDIANIDHRIANGRVGAVQPGIDYHVAQHRCSGSQALRSKGNTPQVTTIEAARLLQLIEGIDLNQ